MKDEIDRAKVRLSTAKAELKAAEETLKKVQETCPHPAWTMLDEDERVSLTLQCNKCLQIRKYAIGY